VALRGDDQQTGHMFSYVSPEQRVPKDHPLRAIRAMTDAACRELSPRFDGIYAKIGRRLGPARAAAARPAPAGPVHRPQRAAADGGAALQPPLPLVRRLEHGRRGVDADHVQQSYRQKHYGVLRASSRFSVRNPFSSRSCSRTRSGLALAVSRAPMRSSSEQTEDHATALSEGHVAQNADRLAAARARRAASACSAKSAATVFPVPKYISSGVCPRNAECGSTWLCSWT
jgi:hypothetical protein